MEGGREGFTRGCIREGRSRRGVENTNQPQATTTTGLVRKEKRKEKRFARFIKKRKKKRKERGRRPDKGKETFLHLHFYLLTCFHTYILTFWLANFA